MIVVEVAGCRLRVSGCCLRSAVVRSLAEAFALEDVVWGWLPRVERSCREVAAAFENFLQSRGAKDCRVEALEPHMRHEEPARQLVLG
ncbi:hypothetical protein [Pyrodictium abyssi]|uniref:Uncharacterized protein n=1 Tax=Pyrodictium abyssi TaxID=54256 RepID=A0ABN6ZU30_9CREN|nr:hypothetical protein PABY_08350 [Pyrodictium abyssi]